MKHVRNFENFKSNRNNVVTESQQNYYYKKGKACQKSIFEMELISEGYSTEIIGAINESYSLRKIDTRIVDCLFEYLTTGNQGGLELLTEEIGGMKLPSFGDMYKGVVNVVDKGLAIGKSAIQSFGNFLKNIGNIIKNLFEKIKAFFQKLWEMFKPNVIAACGVITKAVGGGSPEKMKEAVETISSDQGQSEFDALFADLSAVGAKFKSGNVGNMSPDAEQHLKDEAEDYKGVTDDAEIEKLMQESVERKSTVGKIFYSIKGFISEGGTIEEMEKVFEAEEAKVELKEGDEVTYKNKDGKDVSKKILRIEGDNVVMQLKDGGEFTRKMSEVKKLDREKGKSEGIGKKVLHGFVGEEPEKKGIFGWLVEAVGFVFNPLAKLKEIAIKGGTNGMLTMISSIKRGIKGAFKFVVMGVIAGLVYHIVHGIMALTGEGHGEEHKEGEEEDVIEGGEKKTAPTKKPSIRKFLRGGEPGPLNNNIQFKKMPNFKKESLEFLLESGTVDVNKFTKYTSFFKDLPSAVAPAVGGLLVSALSKFFPIIHTILEIILVSIGIFELVGAMCKLDWVAKKGLKVCKVQHDMHHFLEGAVSGGGGGH
jgi:hypothetical protein